MPGATTRTMPAMLGTRSPATRAFPCIWGGDEWGPYRGRDLIVEWMIGVKKTQSDQRRHCMTNFVFDEISDTLGRIRCFLLVLTAAGAIRSDSSKPRAGTGSKARQDTELENPQAGALPGRSVLMRQHDQPGRKHDER